MAEVTWGRKETIIWPPHKPIYTLGALFLGIIATGLFVYFRFIFVLSPLEQFYLPAYIKTTITASVPIHAKYRMLLASDAKRGVWYARDVDVEPGSTPQPTGKPIPLQLSESARRRGMVLLFRSTPLVLSGTSLHRYLVRQLFGSQVSIDVVPPTSKLLQPSVAQLRMAGLNRQASCLHSEPDADVDSGINHRGPIPRDGVMASQQGHRGGYCQ